MKCLEMLTALPEVCKLFTDILPHTDAYTSHKHSSHKTVLIHVLFKFSVCSNVNELANQKYTGTMPDSLI